jgi:hypothetical protein
MLRLIGVVKAAGGMQSRHMCFGSRGKDRFSISGMDVGSRPGSARMLPLIVWLVVCDEIKNASVVEQEFNRPICHALVIGSSARAVGQR